MTACALGAFDENGVEIPGTRVKLDAQMPVLFGYQPWKEGEGYRLYAGAASPGAPEFQHNQVFEPAAFAELLRGFWKVTGNIGDPPSWASPAKTPAPGSTCGRRSCARSSRWCPIPGSG